MVKKLRADDLRPGMFYRRNSEQAWRLVLDRTPDDFYPSYVGITWLRYDGDIVTFDYYFGREVEVLE